MSCATPDIVMFTLPCCCVWFMSDFDVFTNLDRISRDSYALWLHINAFDQLNLVWIFLHVKNRCASAFVLVPSSLSLGCMHSFLLLLSAHSSTCSWQLQQTTVSNTLLLFNLMTFNHFNNLSWDSFTLAVQNFSMDHSFVCLMRRHLLLVNSSISLHVGGLENTVVCSG